MDDNDALLMARVIQELRKSRRGKQTKKFTGSEISKFILEYNRIYSYHHPGVLMIKRLLSLMRKGNYLKYDILRSIFEYDPERIQKISFSAAELLIKNMKISSNDFIKDYKNLCFFKDKIMKLNNIDSNIAKFVEKFSSAENTHPAYRKDLSRGSFYSSGFIKNINAYPLNVILEYEVSFNWKVIIEEKIISNDWIKEFLERKVSEGSTYYLWNYILFFVDYEGLSKENLYLLFDLCRKVNIHDRDIYCNLQFFKRTMFHFKNIEKDERFIDLVSFFYRCEITYSSNHYSLRTRRWPVDDFDSPENIEKNFVVPSIMENLKNSNFDTEKYCILSSEFPNPYQLVQEAVESGIDAGEEFLKQIKGENNVN